MPQQPTWTRIREARPDALLLLGDNVYLDHDHHTDAGKLQRELEARYADQFREPNFAGLLAEMRAAGRPTFAIYDDHDFLGNNRHGGDHDPALREAARNALVTAFAPPRTGADVYSATVLDGLRLIVLDARYYRQSPSHSRSHRDAMLGAAQWVWLEQQIAAAQEKFVVVASSTPYHSFGDENWEQYPAAFSRLGALLARRPGTLVLSGDIHRNESYDDSGVLELVCSGVSRRGIVFGGLRENFALLDFDDDGVNVAFHGRKRRDQMSFRIPLSNWTL